MLQASDHASWVRRFEKEPLARWCDPPKHNSVHRFQRDLTCHHTVVVPLGREDVKGIGDEQTMTAILDAHQRVLCRFQLQSLGQGMPLVAGLRLVQGLAGHDPTSRNDLVTASRLHSFATGAAAHQAWIV